MTDQLVQTGVGSYDWTGGRAPAGGSHTGTATITMLDGATYTVAHNAAEVQRKRSTVIAPTTPAWVAFDQVALAAPVVLDVSQIATVR